MTNLTLAFTGHRPQHLGGWDDKHPLNLAIRQQLDMAIEMAYNAGYRTFLSGMALGVDIWAAESVLRLRERIKLGSTTPNDALRLVVAIPFWSQCSIWPKHSQERWIDIVAAADSGYVVGSDQHLTTEECQNVNLEFCLDENHRLAYYQTIQLLNKRNEYLVDNADSVLAMWIKGKEGGTLNCIKYAIGQDKKIFHIDPNKLDLDSKELTVAILDDEDRQKIVKKK